MKLLTLSLFGLLLLTSMTHASTNAQPTADAKAGITKTKFGDFPDGRVADLFTLRNAKGMVVQITNYGGYIVSWTAADKTGKQEEIILGVPTFADYLKGTPSLGPIIGRFGNRIAKGKFSIEWTGVYLGAEYQRQPHSWWPNRFRQATLGSHN
nr:hypothetical protein [Spirosoma foliorum]